MLIKTRWLNFQCYIWGKDTVNLAFAGSQDPINSWNSFPLKGLRWSSSFGESHFWLQPFTFMFLLISVQSKFYILLSNWTTTRLLTGGVHNSWGMSLLCPHLCWLRKPPFYFPQTLSVSFLFDFSGKKKPRFWPATAVMDTCWYFIVSQFAFPWWSVNLNKCLCSINISSFRNVFSMSFSCFFFSPSELFIFFLLFCRRLFLRGLS